MTHPPELELDCPYTLEQIQEAFRRTVAFFRANPRRWMKYRMSDDENPFDHKASYWCFAGRLARELGPLPEDYRAVNFNLARPYEPGFAELASIQHRFDEAVFSINDSHSRAAAVVEEEIKLFVSRGLLPEETQP